ncbi:hypothetical protein PSTT_08424 [Puccinia striiformis]|uniref:Uncharacterized protein n=2 Tax=Puccinia striiformis TaxID=27350 RepID=A0A2S4VCH2_9BASI|nr:hypothetical protein PSTT_08424 [Puccinia striiformis]
MSTHNYNLRPRPHRVVSARLAESVPSTPGSRYPLRSRISMGCTMSAIDPLESSSRSNNVFTPVNAPASPVYQPDSPTYPSRQGSPVRRKNSPVEPRTPDSPIRRRPFVVAPETIQDLTDRLQADFFINSFNSICRPTVRLLTCPGLLEHLHLPLISTRLPVAKNTEEEPAVTWSEGGWENPPLPWSLGVGYGDPNLESPTWDYVTRSSSVSRASRSSRHSYNRGSTSSPRRSSDGDHSSAASRQSLNLSEYQTPNNYHRLSSDQIASLLDDRTNCSSYRKCDCGSAAVDGLYKSFVAEYVEYFAC